MLTYSIYITLLSMLLLSMSPLFTPLFELISLPAGMKTIFIQAVGLSVTAFILVTQRQHQRCMREVALLIACWLPFILYVAARTDFHDSYALVKFWKLFFIPFLSTITITIVYMTRRDLFNKYFFVVTVLLIAWQLFEVFINPSVFLYASKIERMTVEGINPIWLARSFVTAALCCLMLPVKNRALKIFGAIIFMLAVLPTGSRGPLIAGIFGFGLYFWIKNKSQKNRNTKAFFTILALSFALALSLPSLAPKVNDYLSRDSKKGAFEESGRIQLFSVALSDYANSPVVGVGFGNYGRGYGQRRIISGSELRYYPHNIVLEVLSELGTIGFILFLIVLRPGRYYYKVTNIYQLLFLVYLVFSMTSGSIVANSGVMIFATLARLAFRYPTRSIGISR